MSEKQFDHIESRIREAADNSEPDYDEHAWKLMEARLNKEENNKPGFLLWVSGLLMLCIAVAGIYWWLENANEKSTEKKGEQITKELLRYQRNNKNGSMMSDSNLVSPGLSKTAQLQPVNSASIIASNQPRVSKPSVIASSQKNIIKKVFRGVQKGQLSVKTIVAEMDINTDSVSNIESENIEPDVRNERIGNSEMIGQPMKDVFPIGDSAGIKDRSASIESKSLKKNTRKSSRFYLLALLGADAGSVKLLSFKNIKSTAKYGIGIGYQINKRLSIQTGFYASWKKYLAGPADYNYKAGSYWTTVKMIKVDASCLVYDLPLTIRYDFIQRPATTYFATAGLSSFIMKKEEYNYHYTRNNMYYQSKKSYTGNKAFLSVVNLSGGIEKSLTPALSLLAEPSVSIPLAGIGDGSVKLYSTAIQFGIKYKPAKRKK